MDIAQSLHRILEQQETMADLFYIVFLERYPEVRHYFEGVNLKAQSVLLTMALMVMERHYAGSYPATEMYLKYLGTKHHDRGIPPELFPKFRDALLATLQRFHSSDWNPRLARQWHDAIERTTTTMLSGYRQHYSV
jgi:hemoglobin-like flavoprotein